MKKAFLLLYLITLSCVALGQNGQLPPVNFSSGVNLCPSNPWTLVFYDEFMGDRLAAPWITFQSWKGMPGGDNDNWDEGRIWKQGTTCILKDANVEVSNGTVKLKVKKEPATWRCNSCSTTYQTDYTTGFISLPYTKSFNSGKFEADIKFPTFKWAHSTFWTWPGGGWDPNVQHSQGVNEIDIAEGYGSNIGYFWGGWPRVNYSLHAWPPGDNAQTNPYNMQHVEIRNLYPNQSWWYALWGVGFKINEFHRYGCEWDPNHIRFFVDGGLVNEFWKYYQDRTYRKWWNPFYTYTYRVGSGCSPSSGLWNTTPGFPYNEHSESNLRFTPYVDKTHDDHSGTLGEMEINYVKMWQRNTSATWPSLCDVMGSTILGPDIICNTGMYHATAASPSGFWPPTSSNLTILSSNSATATVQANGSSPADYMGYIYYYPISPSCPNAPTTGIIWKAVDVGKPNPSVVVCAMATQPRYNTLHYNLHASPHSHGAGPRTNLQNYYSPTTFEWDIYYGPNRSLHHHVFGQYVSTPTISYNSSSPYDISWSVKITNACGTVTKTGQYVNISKPAPHIPAPSDEDLYVVAEITDDDAYEAAVKNRLAQTFIAEDADDVTISSTIEKIEMEELEPYIVLDSETVRKFNTERRANPQAYLSEDTRVFPNPANGFINISLSENYLNNESVKIRLVDLFGRLQKEKGVIYATGELINLELTELSEGLYTLEVEQAQKIERFKIFKTNP